MDPCEHFLEMFLESTNVLAVADYFEEILITNEVESGATKQAKNIEWDISISRKSKTKQIAKYDVETVLQSNAPIYFTGRI